MQQHCVMKWAFFVFLYTDLVTKRCQIMHVMKRGKATSSVSVNTRFSLPNNNNRLGRTCNQSLGLYDVNIEITLHRTRIITRTWQFKFFGKRTVEKAIAENHIAFSF